MYINLLNEKIYYEIEDNNKPLVVFIHGMGGSSSILEAYKNFDNRNYRLLSFDLIGRGNSSCNQPITSKLWLENVKEILKKLNINNFFLLCHSFGCYLGSEILCDKSFKIINNLFVAPYNQYIEKNTFFREKIGKIYPASITLETSQKELDDIYKTIDKEEAKSVLIKNEHDYFINRPIMLDINDESFYSEKMNNSYNKCGTINIVGGESDLVVPKTSLEKLQKLNNNSLIFVDGKHTIISTHAKEINEILNTLIK